jgi:glycine cleavage system H lipoate-binding protein
MVVLLLIATCAVCVLVDWLIHRKEALEADVAAIPPRRAVGEPVFAGGFRIQPELAYHPGHAWVRQESHDTARVGLDDFGCRLIGPVDRIDLPARGARLVQGQEALSVTKGGRRISAIAPVTGRVIAVNEEAIGAPELLSRDPYSRGWLMVVQSRDLKTCLNNLLSGDLVRRWMEDVSARLRGFLPGGTAYSFPDGGAAVDDISAVVDGQTWEKMVAEFMLTRPSPPG